MVKSGNATPAAIRPAVGPLAVEQVPQPKAPVGRPAGEVEAALPAIPQPIDQTPLKKPNFPFGENKSSQFGCPNYITQT